MCVEVTVPPDPVMQQRGLNVELPCHYKTSILKDFMLEWRFAPGSTAPENGKQVTVLGGDAGEWGFPSGRLVEGLLVAHTGSPQTYEVSINGT